MLVIRREQMDLFEQEAVRNFENRMLAHLQECFPKHSKFLGEPGVRQVIRCGLERAKGYGLETERGLRLYVDLMFLLGSGFDADPQLPWAAEILNDKKLPDEAFRIDRLHEKATEYLDKVGGARNEHIDRVLRQIRQERIEAFPASRSADYILPWLNLLHPEKCQYVGEACLRRLLERGVERAEAHGLASPRGVLVCVALMFILGSGFDADPQFPWVAAILNDPSGDHPDQRAQRLHLAAMEYLEKWLA